MLKGKSIGISFGGYVPLHDGHLDQIAQARQDNDGVIVIVGGADTPDERGALVGLPVHTRYELIKEFFAHDSDVFVLECNETKLGIPTYPDGWDAWMIWAQKEVRGIAPDAVVFRWYFGEPRHAENLEKRFDHSIQNKAVYVPRVNPISGTKIRHDSSKYIEQIAAQFRRYFQK